MRRPNQYAVELGKSYEVLKLKAYDDAQPKVDITDVSQVKGTLTIGYGHISDAKLKVSPGLTITKELADEVHLYDTLEAAQIVDHELVYENDLSDNQYSALVDLTFNSGSFKVKKNGKWTPSDLLNALNERNFQIAGELIKTHDIYAGGKIFKGLKRRRLAEYFLYTGYKVGELKPEDWVKQIRKEVDGLIA